MPLYPVESSVRSELSAIGDTSEEGVLNAISEYVYICFVGGTAIT
jgi:hypothetical protein